MIVNGIFSFSLISFSASSLLAFRTGSVYILILYPEPLLKVFIRSTFSFK